MAEPKGYWIVRVDVHDDAAYANYIASNGIAFAKFGARFLIRGGEFENPEGSARARNVVLEFPSYQAALDCYASPEYAGAKALREHAGECDLLIIGAYDGPQPEA